tara:strand:- start:365 stop:493 length:129 start_codon:yes stop_codon:yes gene_type:complete
MLVRAGKLGYHFSHILLQERRNAIFVNFDVFCTKVMIKGKKK